MEQQVKKTLSLLAVGFLFLGSNLALGDPAAQKAAASKPASAAKASKVVRLSDAQLDQIVAGSPAIVLTGGGLTIISNSGNASVTNLRSHHGHITCINQC
jgi:hypothetical protein